MGHRRSVSLPGIDLSYCNRDGGGRLFRIGWKTHHDPRATLGAIGSLDGSPVCPRYGVNKRQTETVSF